MAEYKCMSIELTKGYGNFEFREDIKKLFIIAGVERKSVLSALSSSLLFTSFLSSLPLSALVEYII
jgi:hypothetical protein